MSLRSAFIVVLLAILGLYLTACLFVQPIADDFIFASDARAGLWTAWLAEYQGWAGRYASNALVLSAPASFGPGAYRAAAALMILSLVFAAYVFVRAVSGGRLTRQETWACSLVFSTLYLSQMPSLGESVYWFTAAATHYAPLVLVLVHLALVISYLRSDGRGTADRIKLVLALALLVVVDGFNEVMTLMLLAFYAIWAIWSIGDTSRKPSSRHLPRVLLVLSMLCAAAMLMSPGNTVRRTLYAAVHHRIGLSLGMTVLQTIRFSIDWLSGGALLLATILFVPLAARWAAAWPKESRRATQIMWLSVAGLVLVIPAAVFPAYWETGILGQHRTVNSAYFAFLVLWFVAVAMWLASGSRAREGARGYQRHAARAARRSAACGAGVHAQQLRARGRRHFRPALRVRPGGCEPPCRAAGLPRPRRTGVPCVPDSAAGRLHSSSSTYRKIRRTG